MKGRVAFMHIVGTQLRAILAAQDTAVDVYTSTRKFVARVSPAEALQVILSGRFAGVGNRHRIRHIKPDSAGLSRGLRPVEEIRFFYGDERARAAASSFDHRPTRFEVPDNA